MQLDWPKAGWYWPRAHLSNIAIVAIVVMMICCQSLSLLTVCPHTSPGPLTSGRVQEADGARLTDITGLEWCFCTGKQVFWHACCSAALAPEVLATAPLGHFWHLCTSSPNRTSRGERAELAGDEHSDVPDVAEKRPGTAGSAAELLTDSHEHALNR